MKSELGDALTDPDGRDMCSLQEKKAVAEFSRGFLAYFEGLDIRSAQKKTAARKLIKEEWPAVEAIIDEEDHRLNSMKRGD